MTAKSQDQSKLSRRKGPLADIIKRPFALLLLRFRTDYWTIRIRRSVACYAAATPAKIIRTATDTVAAKTIFDLAEGLPCKKDTRSTP
jgi:hypothetical protein